MGTGGRPLKLATYRQGSRDVVCIVEDGGVTVTRHGSMIEALSVGLSALRRSNVPRAQRTSKPGRLVAPIPRPGKVICAGVNYRSHLDENPRAFLPDRPFFFAKLPSAVIGPDEPIMKPYPSCQLDYEVELAVVIGRRARTLRRDDALDHVFGYTVMNDVSARDLQFASDAQMTLGKGLDTFCPLGPVIVTADEVNDPSALTLRTTVNGDVRQEGSTSDWIFDLATILAALTTHVTLEPGDIVSTGTPAGVAVFRDPPPWLEPGDHVQVEVEGVGRLGNPVAAGWSDPS